jgi:hypothetical protein
MSIGPCGRFARSSIKMDDTDEGRKHDDRRQHGEPDPGLVDPRRHRHEGQQERRERWEGHAAEQQN